MKRKLLFVAMLVAGALGFSVSAQEDITSTYLTNADLSTVDNGWTYYSNDYKYQAWRTGDESKSAAVEFYAGWGSLEHTNFKFSQTVTLPAGDYRIAVNAFYREGNGGNGTNANKAWIFAGDVKQNVYALNGMSAVSAYDAGGDDMDDAMHAFKAGAFSNAFDFSLAEETEISLGFQGLFDSKQSWCILGPVKLYKYSLDDYLVDYDAKYAEADAIDDQIMNADVKSALTSAMVDRSSFSLSSEVTAAIATLTTAINNANNSIAAYTSLKSYMDAVDAKASTLDSNGQTAYNSAATDAKSAYTNRTATDGATEKAALDAAIIAAAKAQTTPGTDWTLAIANPSFENGFSGWTNNEMATQTNASFAKEGNTYCEKWQPNGTFGVSQVLSAMPAGVYRLTVKALSRGVTSAKVFAGGIEVPTKIADEVNTYTVEFACDNNADVTIGFEGTGTGAGASWLALDDFHLTLVGSGLPDVEAVTGKMNAAVATAQTTAIETYNANKTVANYNAASAAIAAAEASKAAYAKLPGAIADANALKEAHNFTTAAAATTFGDAIAAVQAGYDEGTLSDDMANNYGNLGVVAVGWHAQRNEGDRTLAEAYMKSVDFGLNYNDWSVEGQTDGSDYLVPFFEDWVADENSLAEKTISGSLTDLPNGYYFISAWVRVRAKNGVAAGNATGITMDVNGGGEGDYAAVDVTEGAQIGESQFQIETYTAKGLVTDGNLTLNFNIAADNNISWLSFKNVKYTKVRDLTPEEAFTPATAEDYQALAEAIAAKKIGFDEGEYAPYNNIEAIAALKAAQAIDPEASNSQEDVQAATQAISDATWTVNETEVNAIWDASFQHDYSGQEGNVNPIGWQRVKDAAADGYNVRYMGGANAGLAATSSGKALFTKNSAFYGYADGFTMPMKANTYYKVSFIYGGWGDCKKDGYVTMLAPDGSDIELSASDLPLDATDADSNKDSWKSLEAIFQTGEAGDYVLGLRKKNESVQSQYVYGDFCIMRATAADFKVALQQAIDDAQAEKAKYIVGEDLFMYPESEMAPLTNAIATATDALNDGEATVESIIAARETLLAAVENFAPAANAPVAEKAYTITNNTATGNLSINDNTITIEVGATVFFTAVEGGYVLSNAGGKYLFKTNSNNWTLATTESIGEAYVINVNPVEGGYTLQGAKGLMGTDNTDAGSSVYANKTAANNGVWTIAESIPTGVAGIKTDDRKSVIYDLSGRKVEKMVKGVYIINGKKVSIK